MRKTLSLATAAIAFSSFALSAFAAGATYTLFGDATPVGGGTVQLRSDATVAPGYGGMTFDVPAGLTFADLTTLSAEFNVTDDDCVGGSPRFYVTLDTDNDGNADGHVFVYLGPLPSYTGCTPATWESSGNLLDGSRPVDSGQLAGGTFYDPYASALTKYGTASVLGIGLVVDSSWAFGDGEQTVLVRNIVVNGATTKDQCKNGGWKDLGYKNQGHCVSGVASKHS